MANPLKKQLAAQQLGAMLGGKQQPSAPNAKNDMSMEQIAEGVKSGNIDPKEAAVTFINQLPPAQRQKLKNMMPLARVVGAPFAKKMGVSDSDIESFLSEIKKMM